MNLLLPLAALSFAAGILWSFCAPVSLVLAAWGALLPLLGLAAGPLRSRPWTLLSCVGIAALGAGAFVGASACARLPGLPAGQVQGGAATHHVARWVGPELRRLELELLEPAMPRRGGGFRQRAAAVALHGPQGLQELSGVVELYLPAQARPLPTGQRVLLRGRLHSARSPRNPGAASLWRRQLRRGVEARVSVSAAGLVVLGPRGSLGGLARLRGRVRRALAVIGDRRARGVVAALVLGDRSGLDEGLREAFARAGLGHLLAVSGLHLSLVALGALLLLSWGLRRVSWLAARWDTRRPAALAALGVALLYTLLTGAAPATVRACTMAALLLLGLCLARPADLLRPLAAAMLLLLALSPLNLLRAAFQLSFAAVVGIVLLLRQPLLRRWLRGRRGNEVVEGEGVVGGPWSRSLAILARLGRWILGLFIVSLGASAGTAPLVARHFGAVPLAGLVANVVAVPLTSFLLLPAALLGALVGSLSPTLGAYPLALAAWLAGALIDVAEGTAALPGAAVALRLSWPQAVGALLLLWFVLGARGLLRRGGVALGLTLLLMAPLAKAQDAPATLRATFLDVGQGDSTLLQLPGGEAILVDAGGSEGRRARAPQGGRPYDVGAHRVVPALRALGVERIALLVISHPHADHIAGAEAVLRAFPVREVWACWHAEPNRWITRLGRWAAAKGLPLRGPRRWRRGAFSLEPLWPRGWQTQQNAGGVERCGVPGFGANDNSLVLQARFGASSLLLSGDIEEGVEENLLEARAPLAASVLKVPHHGSATSSTLPFLRAVRPRLAVVSAGHGNRFGLPHGAVLARYRRLGIELLRVDTLGAVTVELDADGGVRWSRASSPLR